MTISYDVVIPTAGRDSLSLLLSALAGQAGPPPGRIVVVDDRPVRGDWCDRIPAVVHVDGSARIQTVDRERQPLLARMLDAFEARTGVPVVVNTSLNTAGRPMVDDPRDALECFGSAPVDALALGPYLVRRTGALSSAAPLTGATG